MFLLDTNVLSEVMRPRPEPKVLEWLDAQSDQDLWISSVTIAEIFLGVELLPGGRRRQHLQVLAQRMLEDDFGGRCLPFDFSAANEFATLVAARTERGRPISVEDAQIAAIAVAGGLDLATRNADDFAAISGLALVNPWVTG